MRSKLRKREEYEHDNGVVGKSDIVVNDHLLPNNGDLATSVHSLVGNTNESAQALLEGLAGLGELSLGLGVLGVAVGVDLVTTGGEVLGGEDGDDVLDEGRDELEDGGGGETELTCGGL